MSLSAGAQYRQPVGGVRIALSRHSRRHRGLCGPCRASRRNRDHPCGALCPFRRDRRLAAHPGRGVLCRCRPAVLGHFSDDAAADQEARSGRAGAAGGRLCGGRVAALSIAGSAPGWDPAQHRGHPCHAAPGHAMSDDSVGSVLTLAWTSGIMSLFAVGGANAAIPEIHRIAVDVRHWMTDTQFADVFAISQLSPGPNVLIVTLIGYQVAGIVGALVATLAMCGPTAMLAYFVSRFLTRSSQSAWPAIIQAALVPLSIGLMSASGLILVETSD